ncbi:benzoate/H(+) symporter BenE family transporter [Tianweitania sp. BSSL-BM11]|uniref:Benzoate/H(+) symporter BenE family transporter n=1 Tax=Tianweitania aestuarii TaxID=2814886 RepID=A0ABS5RXA1_9HYPH|nr:benzoate/H(+) symporter BenE family transporter [Tianweitania aestuarii]MBS9721688.1 benzoate/H(+) symporter BenE family transporter [Tianweitania aestuarii]
MRLSIPVSAFVGAFVGFSSTLAIVLAALNAVGATPDQTASAVTAICLALVVSSLILSWRTRMPIVTAWSTPGLALVAASQGFTMGDAVGAFLMTAFLLVGTGLLRPLMRLVARIPMAVSSGMLAGILFVFVADVARAIGTDPVLVLPIVALFFVARLFSPTLSILIVLVAGAVLAVALGRIIAFPSPEVSTLVFTAPTFSFATFLGLSIPLYLVTMASQNLSGLAVLKADGYQPTPGPIIATTGLVSLLSAPFGAGPSNLSAMAAAFCTGQDAHPDPAQRWKTSWFYAATYLGFAVFGASLVALVAVLPPVFIVVVAGLGLLGSFINAISLSVTNPVERFPAVTAFVVTASGLVLGGIGSAFWGLLAGLLVHALETWKRSRKN